MPPRAHGVVIDSSLPALDGAARIASCAQSLRGASASERAISPDLKVARALLRLRTEITLEAAAPYGSCRLASSTKGRGVNR